MASFHLSAKAVSFGKGQSAVATAAYNARTRLYNERNGCKTNDYSRASAVAFTGIFAPKDAPAWARDREQLWNRAEASERQRNGQPARNVEFSLPHELTDEQRARLVKDIVREAWVCKGMVADVAIHRPHRKSDERNHHVHVLLTMKAITAEGFAATKNREWNSRASLEGWREKVAILGARALERAGFETEAQRFRHGHETLEKQKAAALALGDTEFAAGLDREPSRHVGPTATAMERKGIKTERGDLNRAVQERNRERAGLEKELKEINGQIDSERREAWIEQKQGERPLTKIEQDIAAAFAASKDGKGLIAGLDQAGIGMARVTSEDVRAIDALRREEQLTAATDPAHKTRHFPPLEIGELVAVNCFGDVHRLNPNRADASAIEKRLAEAQPHPASVVEVRATFEAMREQRAAFRDELGAAFAQQRDEQAEARLAGWQARTADRQIHRDAATVDREADKLASTADRTVNKGAHVLGGVLGGLRKGVEAVGALLGDMISPNKPPTPDQAERNEKQQAENAEDRAFESARQEKDAAQDDLLAEQRRQTADCQQDLYSKYGGVLTRDPDDPRPREERDDDRGRERERER
jgi:MobA/MobL family